MTDNPRDADAKRSYEEIAMDNSKVVWPEWILFAAPSERALQALFDSVDKGYVAALREKDAEIERLKQALTTIERETIERCAQRIEQGSFLHNDSPAARFAKEAASAIRALADRTPEYKLAKRSLTTEEIIKHVVGASRRIWRKSHDRT